MAQSLVSLMTHIIFSTKDRRPLITLDYQPRLYEYIGGTIRGLGGISLGINGMEDHVHMLVGAPATIAPSKIAQLVKGGSSAWIHDTFPDLAEFGWQDGYGAFTVSKSQLPELTSYIQGQREHHRQKTFQEEYSDLLHKKGIGYDERYLWG